MLWLAFIAIFANIQNSLAACDYCSPPKNPPHTMCESPPDPPCGTSYTFSASDKAKILQHHNKIRQRAASGQETNTKTPLPPACKMPDLQWNDEAASIAQRLTDTCDYGHDDLRNLCNGTYCGQNIAMSSFSPEPSIPISDIFLKLIDSWYSGEVELIGPEDICSFKFGGGFEHYTQIIWAETSSIGCGLTSFVEGGWHRYYIVCNYCVGGNYLDEPVYRIPCDNPNHCDDCCQ
ncbi:UNVERIFIED_CONTAM: hypothetical protein RMT77_001141 [Armadillidium vulgare]